MGNAEMAVKQTSRRRLCLCLWEGNVETDWVTRVCMYVCIYCMPEISEGDIILTYIGGRGGRIMGGK